MNHDEFILFVRALHHSGHPKNFGAVCLWIESIEYTVECVYGLVKIV
jgi:hypothetical protein